MVDEVFPELTFEEGRTSSNMNQILYKALGDIVSITLVLEDMKMKSNNFEDGMKRKIKLLKWAFVICVVVLYVVLCK